MADKRYSINKEYNGTSPKPVYVIRFCGDYVGCSDSKTGAISIMNLYEKNRRKGFYND